MEIELPHMQFVHQYTCRNCGDPFEVNHRDYVVQAWNVRLKKDRICAQCKSPALTPPIPSPEPAGLVPVP